MRQKRTFIILTGTLFLALLGCQAQQSEETITLTWWITYAQDSQEYPTFQAIADAYAEKTGHRVELVSVPWSDIAPRGYGSTRLFLAQESGTGPDIWGPVPHNWTGGFVSEEQVLPLERTQIQSLAQYTDVALWACQVEQKQYGLPVLMDSLALIYNSDLVPEPPTSFEQLIDIARANTDAEADRWGLVLPLVSQYHTYPFIEGYGGYVFNCARDECALEDIGLNNEGAVQGIQLVSDLYLKEKLFPEPLIDREVMDSYALKLFAGGKAAMLIDGSWSLPEIQDSGIDYGVTSIPPMPGATRAPKPLTIIQAMYASSSSPHPEQAIDLINTVANQENVEALIQVLGKTPVRKDILRSPAFRTDREMQAWYDQAAAGTPLPNMPEMDLIWRPWGQALEEAVPGLTPVQDALNQAVDEFNSYFTNE
ncbi:MAG: extracellular solute-binding protein [Anaerolineae bacterium]|nr:extracellular solute-binding protein [Anaerolineae bacterium]